MFSFCFESTISIDNKFYDFFCASVNDLNLHWKYLIEFDGRFLIYYHRKFCESFVLFYSIRKSIIIAKSVIINGYFKNLIITNRVYSTVLYSFNIFNYKFQLAVSVIISKQFHKKYKKCYLWYLYLPKI